MSAILLTGGNGFIAAHILDLLLKRGYNVTTTVRSKVKGDQILAKYPEIPRKRLSYMIVDDIARQGAFDHVLKGGGPFGCVIHSASPFHDNFLNPVNEILEPAINGTTGLLNAIKTYSSSVRRVIVTSSFAAIVNPDQPPKIYDESSWNPVTWKEAITDRAKTYRGSKTFAEKAAWDFLKSENPMFDLVTINPPLVYGPIAHHIEDLSKLNTSNQRIRDVVQGKYKDMEMPPIGTFLFVDARDLALAHVRAMEVDSAAGKRFFVTGGYCSNKSIIDIIRHSHPQLSSSLPKSFIDDFPETIYGYDNSRARNVLGVEFRSLEQCIKDTADSLLAFGGGVHTGGA